jgi:hypothetical protein
VLVLSIAAAITSKSRNVNGVPTSLAQLGYTDVGLDDLLVIWEGKGGRECYDLCA